MKKQHWLKHLWLHTIASPSGGLIFHWNAKRYHRLWESARAEATQLFNQSLAPYAKDSHLVLIGPSAGYLLQQNTLEKAFKSVQVIDPDPLAKTLFIKRHPNSHVAWHSQTLELALENDTHPWFTPTVFCFWGVLGQLCASHGGAEVQKLLHRVHQQFPSAIIWSLHDLAWSPQQPKRSSEEKSFTKMPNEDRIRRFWNQSRGTVHSFDMEEAFKNFQRENQHGLLWSITPRQHHLMEWCSLQVVKES